MFRIHRSPDKRVINYFRIRFRFCRDIRIFKTFRGVNDTGLRAIMHTPRSHEDKISQKTPRSRNRNPHQFYVTFQSLPRSALLEHSKFFPFLWEADSTYRLRWNLVHENTKI